MIDKFKIETPKNIWIEEFIALRSKMYAFIHNLHRLEHVPENA